MIKAKAKMISNIQSRQDCQRQNINFHQHHHEKLENTNDKIGFIFSKFQISCSTIIHFELLKLIHEYQARAQEPFGESSLYCQYNFH